MSDYGPCNIDPASEGVCERGTIGCTVVHPEGVWRSWWIFVIPPGEHEWRTHGSISGPLTADEAIQSAIRHYDQPVWAFALDKGEYGAYYHLHYPEGVEPRLPPRPGRPLGPSGYRAPAWDETQ